MNWTEILHPWKTLNRAKLEIDTLRREQTILREELRKTQKALTKLETATKKAPKK